MRESRTPGSARGAGGNFRPYRDRRQALISWVTRRTRRRDRIEMKAISMKATRCPSVRSKMVFNRRSACCTDAQDCHMGNLTKTIC